MKLIKKVYQHPVFPEKIEYEIDEKKITVTDEVSGKEVVIDNPSHGKILTLEQFNQLMEIVSSNPNVKPWVKVVKTIVFLWEPLKQAWEQHREKTAPKRAERKAKRESKKAERKASKTKSE